MLKSVRFSAVAISLSGAGTAIAATAGAAPAEVLMQPSTWVFALAASALVGLALGKGPSSTIQPLRLRRPAALRVPGPLPA
jgi:hypothetical protein